MNSLKQLIKWLLNWKKNRGLIRWIINIGKNYKRFIFGFLFINFVTMLISLVSSVAGRYVVDAATGFNTDLFYKYILIMLVTTVVSIIIGSLSSLFSGYVNEKFAFGIRADLFCRIQKSDWYSLRQYHSGDLLSRVSSDVDAVASTLISIIPQVVVTFCQLLIVLYILFKNDPVLACIGLVVGPLGLLTLVIFRKKYVYYQKLLRESHSEYYSFLQESFASIGVIKTFQLEKRNNERFDDLRRRRMNLVLRHSALGSLMHSLMRLVYSLGYVITFSWCAYRLSTAEPIIDSVTGLQSATFTYGTMTLFLSLVSQVQGAIRVIGGVIPQCYSLVISAERLREITELGSEGDAEGGHVPSSVSVRAENVSFSYEAEEGNVINGATFFVPAGCHVGIVGTSGAGKTTLIRLLLSLVRAQEGTLEYVDENGNVEQAGVDSRRFISYVPQGNTLISGTVRTNLQLGDPDATEEKMWEALEVADAKEFVEKASNGLDTELKEDAGGLSEGQAQRISIARALLRDRPVLILDEATSALDEATEAKIFERISSDKRKTCFIITHRSSMLKYCDMILEINDDGIVKNVT